MKGSAPSPWCASSAGTTVAVTRNKCGYARDTVREGGLRKRCAAESIRMPVRFAGMGRVASMGVAELILVRHGESTANVQREEAEVSGGEVIPVQCRDADVPLSDLGFAQAQAVGRWLAARPRDEGPTAAWSSPYARALDTARTALAASGTDMAPHIDERLRDKELGVLDTLTSAGIAARFPDEAERRRWVGKFYYRAPGGESWADLALRIRSVLLDLDRLEDGKRVLVFTHDAMVYLFRYVCEGMTEQELLELGRSTTIGNTSITRLVRSGPGWTVAEFNSQAHLLEDGRDLRTDHSAGPPTLKDAAPAAFSAN